MFRIKCNKTINSTSYIASFLTTYLVIYKHMCDQCSKVTPMESYGSQIHMCAWLVSEQKNIHIPVPYVKLDQDLYKILLLKFKE